jgi:hypothetical protein
MKVTLENENGVYSVEESGISLDEVIELFNRVLLSAGYSLPKGSVLGYEYEEIV